MGPGHAPVKPHPTPAGPNKAQIVRRDLAAAGGCHRGTVPWSSFKSMLLTVPRPLLYPLGGPYRHRRIVHSLRGGTRGSHAEGRPLRGRPNLGLSSRSPFALLFPSGPAGHVGVIQASGLGQRLLVAGEGSWHSAFVHFSSRLPCRYSASLAPQSQLRCVGC